MVEEELGISIRNGSRYRRLNRLIPQFGKMVDEEKTSLEKQIDIYEMDASVTKDKFSKLSEWREFEVSSDLEKVHICESARELTKEIADLTVGQCQFFDKDHIEIRLKFSDGFLEMVGMKGMVKAKSTTY